LWGFSRSALGWFNARERMAICPKISIQTAPMPILCNGKQAACRLAETPPFLTNDPRPKTQLKIENFNLAHWHCDRGTNEAGQSLNS